MSTPTIGKRWPRPPSGDYKAECAYCGQRFRRSQLKKDGAGRLACPDDYGPDEVVLTKENLAAGQQYSKRITAAMGRARDGAFHPSGAYTAISGPSGGLDPSGRPVTPPRST